MEKLTLNGESLEFFEIVSWEPFYNISKVLNFDPSMLVNDWAWHWWSFYTRSWQSLPVTHSPGPEISLLKISCVHLDDTKSSFFSQGPNLHCIALKQATLWLSVQYLTFKKQMLYTKHIILTDAVCIVSIWRLDALLESPTVTTFAVVEIDPVTYWLLAQHPLQPLPEYTDWIQWYKTWICI